MAAERERVNETTDGAEGEREEDVVVLRNLFKV